MRVKVFGKGLDLGDNLTDFAKVGLMSLIDKYIGEEIDANLTVKKDNRVFSVEAFLYLHKGFIIRSDGSSDDPYKAVNISIERLENRIRKHKHRLKNKSMKKHWEDGGNSATKYELERTDDAIESDEEHLVIAEREGYVLSLSVSEAVMKLDLTDTPVVMFKNADSGKINVVYKKSNGHVGWIDYKE
jgi:ribosomal subunit interface protein